MNGSIIIIIIIREKKLEKDQNLEGKSQSCGRS